MATRTIGYSRRCTETVPRGGDPRGRREGNLRCLLEETERQRILEALDETRWVIAGPRGAAAQLGVKRSTLQARILKLGITRNR